MRPLSERLELQAKVAMTTELERLLREAAALAKRYEEAPVVTAWPRVSGGPLVISLEGIACVHGQRVRIVLDKEG